MNQQTTPLPRSLAPLFWDYDFSAMSWPGDRETVIGKILSSGDWTAVTWLRQQLKDNEIKDWLVLKQGRGLSPKRLRFWELVLNIPHDLVNRWLTSPGVIIWNDRRV